MFTKQVKVLDTHSKETKIVAGTLAALLTAVSAFAIATQNLVKSIKADDDNDRSW